MADADLEHGALCNSSIEFCSGGNQEPQGPPVQIRYYTTTNDIESAGIGAEGGTAELIKIEDGVYDLVSNDLLTFVTLFDQSYAPYYSYNYYLDVTKIEVIAGATLEKFYDDNADVATFAGYTDMVEFSWLDNTPAAATDMTLMFAESSALTILDLSQFNTSNVTDMVDTFSGCISLTQVDFSNWDTSSLDSVSNLFNRCFDLQNVNLSGWNTTSLTYTGSMFFRCYALKSVDFTGWDMTSVASFFNLFYECGLLECITNIDTTNVGADKTNMFYLATSLTAPDVLTQTQISSTGGFNYVNPNPCPAVV